MARSSGIKELLTPLKSPRANAICERFFGSLKRESLDKFLIFRESQLCRIVTEYVPYYNQQRPHQGIKQQIPTWFVPRKLPKSNQVQGKVISTPILFGLHHSYAYARAAH